MKREVELYFFAVLLLGIVFLLVFFQTGLTSTGFAVFDQQDQTGFGEGVYENVFYDANLSAIVLSVNQTSGDYTSKIFDAGNNSVWNNLTWQGQGILDFQVRACSSSNCSNSNFSSVDLININLTSQYFQYKVSFDGNASNETITLGSVAIDYSLLASPPPPVVTSVSISEPFGQKDSVSDISITFTATGENITCWYNIDGGNNTVLNNCTDSSFDVVSEGSYVLYIYVNGSSGLASDSSAFSVSSSVVEEGTTTTEETTTETEEVYEGPPASVADSQTTKLDINEIGTISLNEGESKDFNLVANNSGTKPLSSCVLKNSGELDWIFTSEDVSNLNPGDEKTFTFRVESENIEAGTYNTLLSVNCFETASSTSLTINVIKETFEFSITDVRKVRNDEVRVTYTLTDLSESDQTIDLKFTLFDDTSQKVSEITDTQNLSANATEKRFRTTIPVNETIEGNLTIQSDINSQVYSSSVNEVIILRAPSILGFVTLGQIGGTGGLIVLVISVLAIFAIIFIVRVLRRSRGMTVK